MLKAPFNFVPLNESLVVPEWSEQISHDIPFSDGLSGRITLEVEAMTDIFVRNGHSREDHETKNENYSSFSHKSDGTFFIPATTFKGEIRNVLEILSFGKMSRVQNSSFGIRDLSNGPDGRKYRANITPANIHCGWLKREGRNYILEDHGLPWRISIGTLDSKFNCGLRDFIYQGDFTNDCNRQAKIKYEMVASCNGSLTDSFSKVKGNEVVFDAAGKRGTIVFTGQPSLRNDNTKAGKYLEFVFPETVCKKLMVSDIVFKEFESIHQDSPDYKLFRKEQLKNKGERIPVFFRYDEKNQVESMGLAYMYKYPARNTVKNGILLDLLFEDKHDLAECIFGYTSRFSSLRGRVMFGHLEAMGQPVVCSERQLVLSTPHPSYYPLYLGGGQTWDAEKVKLAGRKRYPTRNVVGTTDTAEMENMISLYRPLEKGTRFKGVIRFHNLREIELGALLSALTFHGHTSCYHNIGGAKSLGYGKVKCEIALHVHDSETKNEVADYLQVFEKWMKDKLNCDWLSTPQLKELFALAEGIPSGREQEFTYMMMSTNPGENEFKAGKKAYDEQGIALGSFTQILRGEQCRFQVSTQESKSNIRRISIDAMLQDYYLKESQRMQKEEKEDELFENAEQKFKKGYYKEAMDVFDQFQASLRYKSRIEKYNAEFVELEKNHAIHFEMLKSEAERLLAGKQNLEARDKLTEAYQYWFQDKNNGFSYGENLSFKIDECNRAIERASSMDRISFEDFLCEVKLSSPAALGNFLSKWIEIHGPLSDSECRIVADKITLALSLMPKSKAKDWLNASKWKPVSQKLGTGCVDFILKLLSK